MLPVRLPIALATTLLLALIATAGPAAARQEARFSAVFEGTVQSDWNMPKHKLVEDCFSSTWREGSGSETWHVKTRDGAKLLAVDNGHSTQLMFNSFDPRGGDSEGGLPAKAQISRHGGEKGSVGPGTCGVTAAADPEPRQDDCGTLLVNEEVFLGFSDRRSEITPDVTVGENPKREQTSFQTCELLVPTELVAGTWPDAGGKIAKSALYGKAPQLTISGKDHWVEDEPIRQGGAIHKVVSVKWTLTLTRVGAKPAARPGKKPRGPARRRRRAVEAVGAAD